jgi:hypothetical protein
MTGAAHIGGEAGQRRGIGCTKEQGSNDLAEEKNCDNPSRKILYYHLK